MELPPIDLSFSYPVIKAHLKFVINNYIINFGGGEILHDKPRVYKMSQFAGSDCVLQLPNTSLHVERSYQDRGRGLLSIEEGCLRWVSDNQSDHITLDYPSICLHAISRDTSSFPHECLYILSYSQEEDEEEDEEEEEEEEEGEKMTELRFVPPNTEDLEKLYSSICECQTLYPDPELSDDSQDEGEEPNEEGEEEGEDSEGGVFYTSAEEGLPHLSAEGRAVLEHLESVFQVPAPEEYSRTVTEGQNGYNNEQFEDVSEDNNMD